MLERKQEKKFSFSFFFTLLSDFVYINSLFLILNCLRSCMECYIVYLFLRLYIIIISWIWNLWECVSFCLFLFVINVLITNFQRNTNLFFILLYCFFCTFHIKEESLSLSCSLGAFIYLILSPLSTFLVAEIAISMRFILS